MFCTSCGAKLDDGARFCTACGARVESRDAEVKTVESGNAHSAPATEDAPEISPGQDVSAASPEPKRSLSSALIEFRRTTLKTVPTFVIVIVALLLATGTAYALYRVATDVIIPMIEEWSENGNEEPPDGEIEDTAAVSDEESEGKDGDEEEDTTAALNDEAHAAYDEVLEEYRAVYENNDYEYGDTSADGDETSPYWTDLEWVSNSNYPYVIQDINDFSYILGDLEYAYLDLDGDGVDELVLGWSDDPYTDSDYSLLAAVYAYIDGEVKGLDQSYYRTIAYLCDDGIVRECGSGGSLTGGYSWYRIVDGYEEQFESLYYTNFDESGNLFDETREAVEITHIVDDEETIITGTIDDVEEMLAEIDATYPPEEDISWESLF